MGLTLSKAAQNYPVICIMGPTASGKTGLAVELTEHLPAEIISVDSVMVYRDMKIGSALPDEATLAKAPHRLVDFLDPAVAYSAARFREDALREIAEVQANGHIPILVGGTMLYFRALLHGLSELPAADEAIREKLESEAKELGWEAMHDRLKQLDPVAAARIHPNDPQRIQRALEVYEASGISLTEWHQKQTKSAFAWPVIKIALLPADRALLHENIALRFHQMLEQGLIGEVEQLYARGDLDLNKPSIRAVGYRQVWEYLAGNLDYDSMIEKGIVATRQLAKRQLTWLRSEPDLHEFTCYSVNLTTEVLKTLETAYI